MTLSDLDRQFSARSSTQGKGGWPIVGVMGPGQADPETLTRAYQLGYQIADQGWVLLTGGRAAGVMAAACAGAVAAGGLTVGILPGEDLTQADQNVKIPILTGMGSARNQINVLTSRVVVVCGMGPGTASEVALAIKARRPVVLVAPDEQTLQFCRQLTSVGIEIASTVDEACTHVHSYLVSIEKGLLAQETKE